MDAGSTRQGPGSGTCRPSGGSRSPREEARKAAVAELLDGLEELGPGEGKAGQEAVRFINAELQRQLQSRQQMMFE
jgi:hypothetical protein